MIRPSDARSQSDVAWEIGMEGILQRCGAGEEEYVIDSPAREITLTDSGVSRILHYAEEGRRGAFWSPDTWRIIWDDEAETRKANPPVI